MHQPRAIHPNVFIVGQPKSGSTALHTFLHEHPDIFMFPYKEPSYFCRDFHAESDAYHQAQTYFPIRTQAQYAKLFSEVDCETVVGESSINYLYSQVAAKEIHDFNPDAKIVIILRNPVDYLFSFYQMNVRRAWEPAAGLEEALELETRRMRGQDIPPNVHFPSTLYYRQRVQYHDQIQRFMNHFPVHQLHVIIYEDFQRDNPGVFRDTLAFLGVDTAFEPAFRTVNPSLTVRHSFLNRFLRNRWVIRLGNRLAPPSTHVWLQQNILKKLAASPRQASTLDPATRARLMATFVPAVEKTADLLGLDLLQKWGYEAPSTKL